MALSSDIPKRVLLTLDALDMSGVTFALQNALPAFAAHGVKTMLLARTGGERESALRETGTTIYLSNHFGTFLLGHRARAAADAFQPQMIHAQSLAVAKRSYRLAQELNIPLVVTVNRLNAEEYSVLADHEDIGIIAVSDAIRERLTNRAGIHRDRVRCIPNGLDLEQFPTPEFDTTPSRGHVPVVGTYGRLTEQKGQRVFVQAAAEVLRRGVDTEFLVLGQGPDKPVLRRMVEELGIRGRVTFAQATTTDNRNLEQLDLYVEPSQQEGFGLSVLQAMATGIPVVASGVGGLFSLVEDGATGILVSKGDVNALANAIETLLNDPKRRTELARHARERIEDCFEIRHVTEEILSFYAQRLPVREGDA